jgi:hypothetical protein
MKTVESIEIEFHWLIDLTVEFFTIDDRSFFSFKTKTISEPLSAKLHIDQDVLTIIFDKKSSFEISFTSDEFKSLKIIQFKIEPTDEKSINEKRSTILDNTLKNKEIDFPNLSKDLIFQFDVDNKTFILNNSVKS